jgi:hypothetical protein
VARTEPYGSAVQLDNGFDLPEQTELEYGSPTRAAGRGLAHDKSLFPLPNRFSEEAYAAGKGHLATARRQHEPVTDRPSVELAAQDAPRAVTRAR